MGKWHDGYVKGLMLNYVGLMLNNENAEICVDKFVWEIKQIRQNV